MKILWLLPVVGFGFISNLNAQNYQPVAEQTILWYQTSYEDYIYDDNFVIHPLRVDSVKHTGNESQFFFHRGLAQLPDSNFCYTISGSTWMGEKMIRLNDGTCLFFNAVNDTIVVKPNAVPGQTWPFYFHENVQYTAQVDSVGWASFISLSDSVKYISVYNNKKRSVFYIWISKLYGLIKTTSFYDFGVQFQDVNPYITGRQWDLCGFENNTVHIGFHNFGAAEIFDFSPGDEIHTHVADSMLVSSVYLLCKDYRLAKKYLARYISQNGDTLSYETEQCIYSKQMDFINGQYIINRRHDTITEKYILSDLNYLSLLPGQGFENGGNYFFLANSGLSEKPYKNFAGNFGFYDDCWHPLVGKLNKTDENTFYNSQLNIGRFFIGLGGPYAWHGACGYQFDRIVYYKKTGEEIGIPWDCEQLLSVHSQGETDDIHIFPNPLKVSGPMTITGISEGQLELLTVKGQSAGVFYISHDTEIIYPHLKAGVYFCRVIYKSGVKTIKVIVN